MVHGALELVRAARHEGRARGREGRQRRRRGIRVDLSPGHHVHDGRPAHDHAHHGHDVDGSRARAHRRSRQEHLRVRDLHGARQGRSPHRSEEHRGRSRAGGSAPGEPHVIATRQGRRLSNAAGVVSVVGLMSYALYEQHVVGLEACPLCILQRMALIALGARVRRGRIARAARRGRARTACSAALAALTGMGISGWHVRLQNLPPAEVPVVRPRLRLPHGRVRLVRAACA